VSHGEHDSPSLADVDAVVRENVSGHIDGDHHEQGKQRLLAALRPRRAHRKRTLQRGALGAFLLVVAAGGGAYLWKQRQPARLTYEVVGGLLSESGYVRSSGANSARLLFSDGTQLELQDGARARLAAVDAHGARLVVENGHVMLSVARSPQAAWYVDAGPFVIQLTGTQCEIDWSSYDDTLGVDLRDGSVIVSGPPAPAGIWLRAGQRLTAREGRLSIEALDFSAPAAEQAPSSDPLPPVDGEPALAGDLPASSAEPNVPPR